MKFLPRAFPVNCYLVEEEDGLTLVDAALSRSAKGILILREAGAIGKPIVRIVLTHAHSDHTGALDDLKQALPDVPVFISERDSRLLAGDLSPDPGEPASPIRGSVPKRLKTRADILLREEDRIGSLLALSAPGHTPGFDGLSRHENRRPDRRGCLSDEGRDRGGRTAAPGVSLSRLGHLASADRAGKREETWETPPFFARPRSRTHAETTGRQHRARPCRG